MANTDRNSAIARIRTAMIEKKMTQAELADAADCHEKTIQNMLNGRSVRDQTLFDVCMVLGLDFDSLKLEWSGASPAPGTAVSVSARDIAPVHMGAYTRIGVEHYVGSYLTLRPHFQDQNLITAYRTDISWDEACPALGFAERNRPDGPFAHAGHLYIPPSSMFIHFVSLTKGAMRMIIASQLDQTGQIRGLISTLNKQGAHYYPVSAPIAYVRRETFAADSFGEIAAADPNFASYRSILAETVAKGYARLIEPR
jgi:transcriptional regulator with XRE-family HTH domain